MTVKYMKRPDFKLVNNLYFYTKTVNISTRKYMQHAWSQTQDKLHNYKYDIQCDTNIIKPPVNTHITISHIVTLQ